MPKRVKAHACFESLKVCVRAKAKVPSCHYCSGKKARNRSIIGLR